MKETKENHCIIADATALTHESFREYLQSKAREALAQVVAEEVNRLCGPAYGRDTAGELYRAGSAPSYVMLDGRRESFHRPRVRSKGAGGEQEVKLKSIGLAQDPAQWEETMMRAVLSGVSTRDMPLLRGEELAGESRSCISRLWKRKCTELVLQMQQSDLSKMDLLVMVLDAVVLGKGQVATVALGITSDGCKHVLGFRVGGSENKEVCRDLLVNLTGRGLHVPGNRRLLAVLDGSKALEGALMEHFPGALVQRCLVHKERNIKSYLPRKHWKELCQLFKHLRGSQGMEAGEEALSRIKHFLSDKNANARNSLEEAGDSLLALFSLDLPNTLNKTLLSTNCIENLFKNLRRHIGRVCSWRNTDQADRWLSSGLSIAEAGFNRIQGYKDLWLLEQALQERTARGEEEDPPSV